jgi:hypothetical protein
LPEGGALTDEQLFPHCSRLQDRIAFAREVGEVHRDETAGGIWHDVYPSLSEGQAGLLGAATSRSEAQVMRLALLYALLDKSAEIRAEHLMAALAVWDHAEASARYIFGSRLGDPTSDELLNALRAAGESGLTRNEMRDHFSRHKSAEEIGRALSVLAEAGRARRGERRSEGGRPPEIWIANP